MVQFTFETPIPYIGKKTITQGEWSLQYPSNQTYYRLLDEDGNQLVVGNWTVPDDIIKDKWGPDEEISKALIAAEPWLNS